MHAAGISAFLLYGLSWMLIGVAALMAALAMVSKLGLTTLPAMTLADLTGAAFCCVLAFLCRVLARKFDQV